MKRISIRDAALAATFSRKRIAHDSRSTPRSITKAMKTFSLPSILALCALRGALVLAAVLILVQPCEGDPGGFTPTGSLNTARASYTATLLPNGMVLVAGGDITAGSASAELYDPALGSWGPTGSLNTGRDQHTATLLPNGMVLVAAGFDIRGDSASAELYDPALGSWSPTGSLNTGRYNHTATLLSNGKVLVAGGEEVNGNFPNAELYDPALGSWSLTGKLNTPRFSHTATLLPNGMVLVAGGFDIGTNILASAELYDPAIESWILTGNLNTARYSHTATLLSNGMVLVAGGLDSSNTPSTSAEIYDPSTGSWSSTGSLNTGRDNDTATLLPDGMVLVAGGEDVSSILSSAELYDPTLGSWSATGSLATARDVHTATLLPNGTVLVAGGDDVNGALLTSAELYDASRPIITSPLFAMCTVGLPFSYQFEATGALTLSVDENTLPNGLTYRADLHAIVGNPTINGTFNVGLIATNQFGPTNATLVLTVQPAPASGPVITSITSATGRTGSPFNFQVLTNGGSSEARLSFDSLPAGLNADPVSGQISGTVITDGSYLVFVTVTDGGFSNTGTLQLTFTSDPEVPVIVSSNTEFITLNQSFSYTIKVDGGENLSFANVGQLPPGLSLNSNTGVISGTPTFSFSRLFLPELAGGVISNVALYAINNSTGGVMGTQLVFFLAPNGAANISTRANIGTGDNVLIAGFIISEALPSPAPPVTPTPVPMEVVLRGIGPSLQLAGALSDPFLELRSSAGTVLGSNNDWKVNLNSDCLPMMNCSQEVAINSTTIAPTNSLESAILALLSPGSYTAILSGNSNGTGIGLVELYDRGAIRGGDGQGAYLANISTRGMVQTGDNVMIGGFINTGTSPIKIIVRAIGPSLTTDGTPTGTPVPGRLLNPSLELHRQDGSIILKNDNWKDTQQVDIEKTGIPPPNDLESAIVYTLPENTQNTFARYTAVVSGVDNTSGVALVEVYFGNPCLGTLCP